MGKVKKTGDVSARPRPKAKGAGRAPNGAPVRVSKTPAGGRTAPGASKASYRVRALDPLEKCGRRTTVQHLYRVDETVDGATHAHLVFFDRHGWYCEHGPNCPAVVHARAFDEAHA